jgi:hypothetical protein
MLLSAVQPRESETAGGHVAESQRSEAAAERKSSLHREHRRNLQKSTGSRHDIRQVPGSPRQREVKRMTVNLLMSIIFVAAIIALLLEVLFPVCGEISKNKRRKK